MMEMKRGKDEGKVMGPMFPRLHLNDTEKGGPRAPPRNKMALYEQLSIPSKRFSHTVLSHNRNGITPNSVPRLSQVQKGMALSPHLVEEDVASSILHANHDYSIFKLVCRANQRSFFGQSTIHPRNELKHPKTKPRGLKLKVDNIIRVLRYPDSISPNTNSASESAAIIFRSIQEERRRHDSSM